MSSPKPPRPAPPRAAGESSPPVPDLRPRPPASAWRTRIRQHPDHRRFVLWTCLAGCFATTFTMTILGVSLRAIADDLGSDVTTIAWVVTAPMLAQAVSAQLLGKLGDLHGHRRVYLSGFLVATGAAMATAFAWSAPSLIALRTLGQVAGTATMPASMAMLFRAYPGRERVRAMGWMSVVIAGGPVVGLAVGGWLVETIGWRPIFLIQAGLSAVAWSVALLVLVETPRQERVALDVRGAATLALAAFALVSGINRAPIRGLLDPAVAAAFVATPVLLALFARVERRAANPLLPLPLLRERNFVLPLAIGFLLQFAYMGGFIISPLIMLGVFGLGQAATSMWTIARPIALSASSPFGGHLGATHGERTSILAGSTLVFLAMVAFAAGASLESLTLVIAGLVLAGVGMGFAQPSLSTLVASAVDERNHGIAVSTMATTTGIGAVAGVSILTALCADSASPVDFRNGYGLGALVALVGVLAGLRLPATEATAGVAAAGPPREGTRAQQAGDDLDDLALPTT